MTLSKVDSKSGYGYNLDGITADAALGPIIPKLGVGTCMGLVGWARLGTRLASDPN